MMVGTTGLAARGLAGAIAVAAVLLLSGCAGTGARVAALPSPPETIAPITGAAHLTAMADPKLQAAMSLDGKNDFAGAAAAYRQAADGGNPVARYLLAEMYESGDGVPHDQAEAARQFPIAALAGYAPAQTHLGDHYEKGNGVARDQDLANRWYRFAADAGEDTATGRLAMPLIDGDGMPRDVETGLRLLRNFAEPGGGAGGYHPRGEAGGPGCPGALGAPYLEGHGVK